MDRFNKSILADTDILNSIYYQKFALCDIQILLVTLDEPDMERLTGSNYDAHTLAILFNAWRSVAENSTNISKQNQAWRMIDQIGGTIQSGKKNRSSAILRRFKTDFAYNQYFLLLNGQEPQGIPASALGPICNVWQMANEHFPLHASGIIHKNQLFVFTGPSGAGKSTVAELSREIGDSTLDEDQILVSRQSANRFRARAWGYNLDSCDLPIRAVFNLFQDVEDRIVPMKPMTLARLLLERHNDVMANQSPNELIKKSFEFFAEASRQIPGFDLHFRKSPDFWKLIDEQALG